MLDSSLVFQGPKQDVPDKVFLPGGGESAVLLLRMGVGRG